MRSEKRETRNENEGWRVEKQKKRESRIENRESRIENRGPRTENRETRINESQLNSGYSMPVNTVHYVMFSSRLKYHTNHNYGKQCAIHRP